MHYLSLLLLPATLTSALQIPDNIQSFISAFSISLDDYFQPNTTAPTLEQHDLLKRQYSNTCPTHFSACDNLGAPNLCCASEAVCSADAAGHVACCPSGAACSGTIAGVITAGTVNSVGSLMSGTATTTALGGATTSSFVYAGQTTTTNGLVAASVPSTVGQQTTNSNGGFVIDGTSTVATPGAAVRGVEIPLIARAIIRALEYLPI